MANVTGTRGGSVVIPSIPLILVLMRQPVLANASRTEQVLSVKPGLLHISISGTNGHIHIRYGKAREVYVKTLVRADSVAKLSETSEKLSRVGNDLTLKQIDAFTANHETKTSYQSYSPPIVDLTLSVPRETNLTIETYNADIEVEGISGAAFLNSYNGRINYEAQTGQPQSVYAGTRNGKLKSAVHLSADAESPVHLQSYNGDILVTATAQPKRLINGKFFNGRRFVSEDWFVVDGLLTKRSPAVRSEVEDLKGRFVAPAYGDAHTHHFEGSYFSRLMVGKYLPEGTLFAQTMTEHVSMKADANTVVNRPDSMDVAFADAGFTATNGHPTFTYESLANKLPDSLTPQQRSDRSKDRHTQEGDAYWIVDTPEQLDQVWPRFLSSDPDLVKVFLVDTANREKNKNGLMGSLGLDPAVLPLIVRRSHEAGLRVYAHIDTALDFKIALEAGVDGLAHMPGYGFNEGSPDTVKLTPDLAKLATGHYVQLTAGLAAGYAGKNLRRTQNLQAHNIRQLRLAGATPVIGSDSYGSTTRGEVEAWFQLGQTPLQVLTALSKDSPQSIFPWRSIGEIREGYEADLVVLRENPLKDRGSMLRADRVLKRGETVYPATPLPSSMPKLVFTPPAEGRFTAGEPLNLSVKNVQPSHVVTVHGFRKEQKFVNRDGKWIPEDVILHSWALFRPDPDGSVNVDSMMPVAGTWTRANPLGLFWSGHPLDTDKVDGILASILKKLDLSKGGLTLMLESDQTFSDPINIQTWAGRTGVTVEDVRTKELVGSYAKPAGKGRFPVVVVLHGSEGASEQDARNIAARFAARGFATFSLSYATSPWVSIPGVKKEAVNVPIESIETARAWLSKRAEVDISRFGLVGWSKGGEFSLVAAAKYPWIKSVVALVPSDLVWQGYGRNLKPGESGSSWSWRGEPLPYIPYLNFADFSKGKLAVRAVDWHRASLAAATKEQVERARISVDKITAKVLLLSGGKDDVWPSWEMSERVRQRMSAAGKGKLVRSIVFPNATHQIVGDGIFPVFLYDSSPKAEENGYATVDAFQRTVEHLRSTL